MSRTTAPSRRARPERREQRLLHPVGGGARAGPLRGGEPEPAGLPRDDPGAAPAGASRSTRLTSRWLHGVAIAVSGSTSSTCSTSSRPSPARVCTTPRAPTTASATSGCSRSRSRATRPALELPPEEVRARLARGPRLRDVQGRSRRGDLRRRGPDPPRPAVRRPTLGTRRGWVDTGEDPAETIVREVHEEVGLDATHRRARRRLRPAGLVVRTAHTVRRHPLPLLGRARPDRRSRTRRSTPGTATSTPSRTGTRTTSTTPAPRSRSNGTVAAADQPRQTHPRNRPCPGP